MLDIERRDYRNQDSRDNRFLGLRRTGSGEYLCRMEQMAAVC